MSNKEMIDSGIDWIGNFPINWRVKKVKHLATEQESVFIDGDWIESDIIVDEGIRYLTTGNVGPGYFKRQGNGYITEETFRRMNCLKVLPDDLMISRLNEPIGRACIVPNDEDIYVVAVDNVILRPNKDCDKKYLMYVMNSDGYTLEANRISRGATMSRISRTQLGNLWVPFPNKDEQKLIATFLDYKCSNIDSIIGDLENQIEILEEYRKSVITETVTKGLNPDVDMKESGIDWIGMIPFDFDLMPLKYLFNLFAGGDVIENDFESEESDIHKYPVYSNSLYNNGLMGYTSRFRFSGKTITVTGRGDVGKAVVRFDSYYPVVRLLVCVPKSTDDVRYFTYFINSLNLVGQQTAMAQLTTETLGNQKVLRPSFDKQRDIADFLDKKCSEIDSIIEDKKNQIETIKKYKNSLIYEYVTGKKRVSQGDVNE